MSVKFIVIASKPTVPWWMFYNAMPLPLQEGAKAHYMVKHNKNKFANGLNHINGIENFFVSCYTLATASRRGFAKFRLAKFKD
ncbi:hypothetical protein DMC01_08790 [Campylobacter troglodytis]|nr:hypothetical protein DMC01_08790 [Campylobacter troglodytis]